jgi:hypothetical protein
MPRQLQIHCKRGHVLADVGRTAGGWCLACAKEYYYNRYELRDRTSPKPYKPSKRKPRKQPYQFAPDAFKR